MKAVGIIAEYNPFHNGHLFHLQQAKRLTGRGFAVAVISGPYVQRGEPAILPKRERVKAALINGADVVLELPVFYAVAAADYFARGAVKILAHTGIVDSICFGSECGDMAALTTAADVLLGEPPAFKHELKRGLNAGLSYAAARGLALEAEFERQSVSAKENIFTQPNNNLGIEYIKAIKQLRVAGHPNAGMEIFTVKRASAEADGIAGGFASASFIREAVLSGQAESIQKYLPSPQEFTKPRQLDDYSHFFKTFLYRAQTLYHTNLAGQAECCLNAPDMTEGLQNRFLRETLKHEKLSGALLAIKTKRYALTRLQRTALHLILGITRGDMDALEHRGGPPWNGPPWNGPQYLRLLGYRRESAALLSAIAKNASLPFIADTSAAKKVLPPFALTVFEREMEISPPEEVVKV